MVPSGIEPLIPALLARCLNQLGQGTNSCRSKISVDRKLVSIYDIVVYLYTLGRL